MKVLLDTNILLDILERRLPFFTASVAALERCQNRGFRVYMAWHSLANCLYIYGRKTSRQQANQVLRELLEVIEIAPTGHFQARRAFSLGFDDTEDAMQAVAAESCGAAFILTRNSKDFARSPIRVLTPEQFMEDFPTQATEG